MTGIPSHIYLHRNMGGLPAVHLSPDNPLAVLHADAALPLIHADDADDQYQKNGRCQQHQIKRNLSGLHLLDDNKHPAGETGHDSGKDQQ